MKFISALIMASVKNARVPRPPRSKSTNSRPSHPQTRTLKTGPSRPLQQSNSDASLSSRLKNLSVKDGATSKDGKPPDGKPPPTGRVRNIGSASQTRRFTSQSNAVSSLEDVVRLIKEQQVKKVVVMAGAGISTASGIPDFRTPGTGLYDNLKQYRIPYPEAIFDIDYFIYTPKPFFTLAKELYPSGKYKPNYVHYFVRMLHEKGLLHRMYTQNIDGLERLAGVPASKLVEAHGTFATATCVRCRKHVPGDAIRADIFGDKIPRCQANRCNGIIKPDIVFFGEDLPKRFYFYLKDFPQADLLIVMGTSLEVEPFAGIVDSVRYSTPRLLINRDPVGPFVNSKRTKDAVATGDLVENVEKLISLLGWKKETDKLISDNEILLKEMEKNPEKFMQKSAGGDNNGSSKTGAKTNLNRPKRGMHTFSAKSEPNLPRTGGGANRNNHSNNNVKFPAIKGGGQKKDFSTVHWRNKKESSSEESSSEEETSSEDDN